MRLYYLTQHLTQHLTWHLFNSTLPFGHWLIYLFINLKKWRQLLGIGLLVTCLTCHLGKGNLFEIRSRNLVDDVAYQLYLPIGIPSLSYLFIPCLEVEILKETGFSVWLTAVGGCADITYLPHMREATFLRKFFLRRQYFLLNPSLRP